MLNFVVALRPEASPLIEAFKLRQQPDKHYPVFSSDSANLIICGMGRNRTAAATAWLAARYPAKVWLNVGIAGHADREIGTLWGAHKITEYNTNKNWYPVHIKSPVATESLTTFDSVQRSYRPDSLHDMEASAFYETAIRFSTAELTHSIKVVSDNLLHPVDTLDKAMVANMITDHVEQIRKLCEHLCDLAIETDAGIPSSIVNACLAKWNFTVTQKHQLQRVLQRRQALGLTPILSSDINSEHTPSQLLIPDELATLSDSKSVIRWLQHDTDKRAQYF